MCQCELGGLELGVGGGRNSAETPLGSEGSSGDMRFLLRPEV